MFIYFPLLLLFVIDCAMIDLSDWRCVDWSAGQDKARTTCGWLESGEIHIFLNVGESHHNVDRG